MRLLLNHWWPLPDLFFLFFFNVYLVEYYTTSFKAEIFTQIYLDEAGCSRDLSVEVLLSLLLLDFEGKPWAQDTLIGKRIRIDCIDSYQKKICHYEVVYTFSVQVVEYSCKFHRRNSFFLFFTLLHQYCNTENRIFNCALLLINT